LFLFHLFLFLQETHSSLFPFLLFIAFAFAFVLKHTVQSRKKKKTEKSFKLKYLEDISTHALLTKHQDISKWQTGKEQKQKINPTWK